MKTMLKICEQDDQHKFVFTVSDLDSLIERKEGWPGERRDGRGGGGGGDILMLESFVVSQ